MRKRVASATAIERDIWKDVYRPAMKEVTKMRSVVDRILREWMQASCVAQESVV